MNVIKVIVLLLPFVFLNAIPIYPKPNKYEIRPQHLSMQLFCGPKHKNPSPLSPKKHSQSLFHFEGGGSHCSSPLSPLLFLSSSFYIFPHFQRQRVVPICLSFVMIFIQSLKAAAAQRRIFTCISASDLHHHLFCNFFMFGISCRDSLGSLCSFHLSFCESFSSLFCETFSSLLGESFICIVMAWFFQALSFFYLF